MSADGVSLGSSANISPAGVATASLSYAGQQDNRNTVTPFGTYNETTMVPPIPLPDECDMRSPAGFVKVEDIAPSSKKVSVCALSIDQNGFQRYIWKTPYGVPGPYACKTAVNSVNTIRTEGTVCTSVTESLPVISPDNTKFLGFTTATIPIEFKFSSQKDGQGRLCCYPFYGQVPAGFSIANYNKYTGPLGTINGIQRDLCAGLITWHPDYKTGTCSAADQTMVTSFTYPAAAGCNAACSRTP
jgi:hypothetical protein